MIVRHFGQDPSTNLRGFADLVTRMQQNVSELSEIGMVHFDLDRAFKFPVRFDCLLKHNAV